MSMTCHICNGLVKRIRRRVIEKLKHRDSKKFVCLDCETQILVLRDGAFELFPRKRPPG